MKNEKSTLADDLALAMEIWNKIEAVAKAQFPNADKEKLYKICSAAFDYAIGIKKGEKNENRKN